MMTRRWVKSGLDYWEAQVRLPHHLMRSGDGRRRRGEGIYSRLDK